MCLGGNFCLCGHRWGVPAVEESSGLKCVFLSSVDVRKPLVLHLESDEAAEISFSKLKKSCQIQKIHHISAKRFVWIDGTLDEWKHTLLSLLGELSL